MGSDLNGVLAAGQGSGRAGLDPAARARQIIGWIGMGIDFKGGVAHGRRRGFAGA